MFEHRSDGRRLAGDRRRKLGCGCGFGRHQGRPPEYFFEGIRRRSFVRPATTEETSDKGREPKFKLRQYPRVEAEGSQAALDGLASRCGGIARRRNCKAKLYCFRRNSITINNFRILVLVPKRASRETALRADGN